MEAVCEFYVCISLLYGNKNSVFLKTYNLHVPGEVKIKWKWSNILTKKSFFEDLKLERYL
jgi:hypothetical protein